MFKRQPDDARPTVVIEVDGRPVTARAGDTVAAALLAAGSPSLRRTPVTGTERGPYCMMGVCFDCLVTIDGAANRQSCLVPVRDGMAVVTGQGKRSIGA